MTKHGFIHYRKKEMHHLRITFEKRIRRWPDVVMTMKLQVPHYIVDDVVFARIFTYRMVLTNLNDDQKREIIKKIGAQPFKTPTMSAAIWTGARFKNIKDIKSFLPYVRMSYENSRK